MGQRRRAVAGLGAVTADQEATAPVTRTGRWQQHVFGLLVTTICLVVIIRQVDVASVLEALATFQWAFLLPALLALALGYTLRIVRWAMMLRAAGATAAWHRCAAPFLGSIALNNVLPLRLGDVVRALVFPAALGVTRTLATGSLVVERLVDLMTLLAALAIGLALLGPAMELPAWLGSTGLSLAAAGGLALVTGLLFSGPLARWLRARTASGGAQRLAGLAADLLAAFAAMLRPSVLLKLLAASALVWIGEAGLFLFMLKGFGLGAGPAEAIVVMAVATLATLVPSSPGYVGPFHLAAYTAVSLLGGDAAMAASFALLAHLALWLPTTLAGALGIAATPQLFRGLRRPESTS